MGSTGLAPQRTVVPYDLGNKGLPPLIVLKPIDISTFPLGLVEPPGSAGTGSILAVLVGVVVSLLPVLVI